MESREKDNTKDSEQIDWGMIFMMLKSKGFTHKEILKLSYPQFNAYMKNICNPMTYPIMIPYLGSGEEINNDTDKINSKEELLNIVASMNNDFS